MFQKYKKEQEQEQEYWLSIGDLMAGALIIFILLFVLQILNVNNKLTEKENMIKKMGHLEQKVSELEVREEKLNIKANALGKISGIKQDIIQQIIKKFKEENLKIEIDGKTGNIKLDDKILFNSDSDELKPEGKEFLKIFVPQYINIFFADNNIKRYISQIVIEGHTDDIGSYLYNLDLSQRRALNVVKFIYSDEMGDFEGKSELQKIITANGRSKMVPILSSEGDIDRSKSRRVEFQFKLDDDKSIREIKRIIESEVD